MASTKDFRTIALQEGFRREFTQNVAVVVPTIETYTRRASSDLNPLPPGWHAV